MHRGQVCDFGASSGYPEIEISGLLDSVGASPVVSAARFIVGVRRKRGPEIDKLRRPAGVRVREPPRPQIARFRADAKICDFRRHCRGNPEIGISGSRQEFIWGGPIRFRRRVSRRLRRMFRRGFQAKTGSGNWPTAPTGGGPRLRVAPPTNRPISGWRENPRFPERLLGKSGNRDFGISSGIHGGGLLDSGGAFSDVPIACFGAGFRRKRGPKIDRLRRPARVRV